MATWDELEQKFGQPAAAVSAGSDPWAALEQKYAMQEPPAPKQAIKTAPANPDDNLPDSGVMKYLPNSVKAGLVSTGREFDKLAKGAESGWYRITGQDDALAKLRAGEKENDASFAPLADAHPIATTVGGIAPYLAVSPGSFASVPAAAVRAVAPKAAVAAGKIGQSMILDSALQGAALGQLRQGDETGAATGAIGGAVGGAIGRGVQKVISPKLGSLGAQQQSVIEPAQRMGARMTPGQTLNNQTLQRIEAGLESNPVTSFAMRGVREANQTATNRAAAKSIGEGGTAVDAGALANAEERIGNVYKMVRTKTAVDLSGLSKPITEIMEETKTLTVNPNALDTDPLFNKALDFVTKGGATQEELVSLSSQLGKRGKSLMTSQAGDRDLGIALFKTKDVVDDALEGALKGDTKKLFADARGQYRSLMQLYGHGVVNEQTGNVNAKVLANNLASKDRKGFRLGGNDSDLYNMARFTRAFPSIVGDSGTATRLALPLLGGAAAGGTLGYASGGDPIKGVQAGLASTAIPMLLARGYMSPATTKFLGNGLLSTGMPNDILRRLAGGAPTGLLAQQ
jgi:hypothetical protein